MRPIFVVQVRAEPGVDAIRALRAWLKIGLRIYGSALRRSSGK